VSSSVTIAVGKNGRRARVPKCVKKCAADEVALFVELASAAHGHGVRTHGRDVRCVKKCATDEVAVFLETGAVTAGHGWRDTKRGFKCVKQCAPGQVQVFSELEVAAHGFVELSAAAHGHGLRTSRDFTCVDAPQCAADEVAVLSAQQGHKCVKKCGADEVQVFALLEVNGHGVRTSTAASRDFKCVKHACAADEYPVFAELAADAVHTQAATGHGVRVSRTNVKCAKKCAPGMMPAFFQLESDSQGHGVRSHRDFQCVPSPVPVKPTVVAAKFEVLKVKNEVRRATIAVEQATSQQERAKDHLMHNEAVAAELRARFAQGDTHVSVKKLISMHEERTAHRAAEVAVSHKVVVQTQKTHTSCQAKLAVADKVLRVALQSRVAAAIRSAEAKVATLDAQCTKSRHALTAAQDEEAKNVARHQDHVALIAELHRIEKKTKHIDLEKLIMVHEQKIQSLTTVVKETMQEVAKAFMKKEEADDKLVTARKVLSTAQIAATVLNASEGIVVTRPAVVQCAFDERPQAGTCVKRTDCRPRALPFCDQVKPSMKQMEAIASGKMAAPRRASCQRRPARDLPSAVLNTLGITSRPQPKDVKAHMSPKEWQREMEWQSKANSGWEAFKVLMGKPSTWEKKYQTAYQAWFTDLQAELHEYDCSMKTFMKQGTCAYVQASSKCKVEKSLKDVMGASEYYKRTRAYYYPHSYHLQQLGFPAMPHASHPDRLSSKEQAELADWEEQVEHLWEELRDEYLNTPKWTQMYREAYWEWNSDWRYFHEHYDGQLAQGEEIRVCE